MGHESSRSRGCSLTAESPPPPTIAFTEISLPLPPPPPPSSSSRSSSRGDLGRVPDAVVCRSVFLCLDLSDHLRFARTAHRFDRVSRLVHTCDLVTLQLHARIPPGARLRVTPRSLLRVELHHTGVVGDILGVLARCGAAPFSSSSSSSSSPPLPPPLLSPLPSPLDAPARVVIHDLQLPIAMLPSGAALRDDAAAIELTHRKTMRPDFTDSEWLTVASRANLTELGYPALSFDVARCAAALLTLSATPIPSLRRLAIGRLTHENGLPAVNGACDFLSALTEFSAHVGHDARNETTLDAVLCAAAATLETLTLYDCRNVAVMRLRGPTPAAIIDMPEKFVSGWLTRLRSLTLASSPEVERHRGQWWTVDTQILTDTAVMALTALVHLRIAMPLNNMHGVFDLEALAALTRLETLDLEGMTLVRDANNEVAWSANTPLYLPRLPSLREYRAPHPSTVLNLNPLDNRREVGTMTAWGVVKHRPGHRHLLFPNLVRLYCRLPSPDMRAPAPMLLPAPTSSPSPTSYPAPPPDRDGRTRANVFFFAGLPLHPLLEEVHIGSHYLADSDLARLCRPTTGEAARGRAVTESTQGQAADFGQRSSPRDFPSLRRIVCSKGTFEIDQLAAMLPTPDPRVVSLADPRAASLADPRVVSLADPRAGDGSTRVAT